MNPDSLYYGGYFKAKMTFPKNYPYRPPGKHADFARTHSQANILHSDFQFVRPLFHPNIYPDGKLCISILHPPEHDEMSGEDLAERWSPIQNAESVLLSIISLLDDAEVSSPANVDAGVMLRKDPAKYKKRVAEDVEKSKQDIPEGFVMPDEPFTRHQVEKHEDEGFWYDCAEDDDFGGSDTSEMLMDEGDDEEEMEDEEDEEIQQEERKH